MKKKLDKELYPKLKQLGIKHDKDIVKIDDLNKGVEKRWGKKGLERFDELFGIQTAPVGGLYPWDVEAVLVRMIDGRLTGSQLWWD